MHITYLLLAHDKPHQFKRVLAALLRDDRAAVVAHVDAKSDERPFREAAAQVGGRVTFVDDREDIRWGGFASVVAELRALQVATTTAPGDYYLSISGADYPIRPFSELHAELESGAIYMNSWAMPSPENGKPMHRLEAFFYAPANRHNQAVRVLNRALRLLPKRNVAKGLGGRQPFGGSARPSLPHDVALAVLATAATDERLMRFLRFSRSPDETFFQTVVESLPHGREVRPALTFTDWSRAAQRGSPATLTSAAVPAMRASGLYFARKFDLHADPDVFAEIDRHLLGVEPGSS